MIIELLQPHEKQAEIVDACLDENIFFIVAIIGRQFGKTTIAENLAIYWSLNEPDQVVYWVSPTDSQAQKVYKEIVNAVYESGCIKSKKMPRGDTEIVFTNSSKILFRSAASEDSLRGQSVDYMIMDEAAFIKKDTVETILLPMLNVRGKKCLFISTPKGKNFLYEYFLNGQKLDKWKSLRYSTYDSPYANEDLINMFRDTLAPKLFQQEVEAEFVDSSSIFNNIADVMCLEPIDKPQEDERYFAGIDIGFINDASVLSIINKDGHLVKYYRWQNIEAPELMDEIVEINKKWNFVRIVIENNNQGLTIYQDLKRRMKNIDECTTTSKTKPEMNNRLIHLFNTKEIKLVVDEYLRIELEAFIFKQNTNGNIKFMAESGFHDDCVMSMAIAIWCYENKNYGKNVFRIHY